MAEQSPTSNKQARTEKQKKALEKRPPPTGFKLRHTLTGHSYVFSVAWSPDGRTLASGSIDQTIRLWEPQSSQAIQTLKGHTDYIYSVAWSPDGRMLASGSGDRSIRLWNPSTGQCTKILEEHTETVRWVSFSPDGRLLGSKSEDGTVRRAGTAALA